MIFVVQKLLMPATLHLMIQGCKEVRTVPDLCAAFSAVQTHLPSSFHIRPGRNPGSETLCSQGAGWYRMQEPEDRQLGHMGKRRLTFWQKVSRRGDITSLRK